jgi:D-alanine-D-alanine ligase
MDKEFTKRILDAAGLEVGRWAAVRRADRADAPRIAADLGYPVFVKPARAGSSVGVSRAEGPDELERAVELAFAEDSKILIEHELRGREVEIAVLGPRTGEEPRVSSVAGEIVVSSGGFYDYRSKYLSAEQATTICPADVTPTQLAALQQAARATFVALDCAGLARVDMFLDGDVATINEINTLPGFTPISIFPICWEKSGLDYTELITDLLEQAQGR